MGFLSSIKNNDLEITASQVAKIVGWTPTKCTQTLGMVDSCFAADDNANNFAIFKVGFKLHLIAAFKYEDILSAEIRVGKQVTTTKKSISAAGALAGSVLGGGLGAVVGGVGLGKSESSRSLSDISIHILIRNHDQMSIDVPCHSIKEAQAGMDLISLAIDKADKESQLSSTPVQAPTPTPLPQQSSGETKSKIQDLKELSELFKQGLITDEEFSKLKAEILK